MRHKERLAGLAFLVALTANGAIIFQSKIALEGGVPLPTTPLVIPKQEGRMLWVCRVLNIFGNGNLTYGVFPNVPDADVTSGIPDDCRVTIRLQGYETVEVTLHDKSLIVLKRASTHESSVVSASSTSAPQEAKKAYEKGVEASSKKKWEKAQSQFERAVEISPDYAQAWTDLGDVLKAQSKMKEAQAAYERAIKADPKYLRAYVPAARLALDEGRIEDGLNLTETIIGISPNEYPEAYFYNAVANYNLKRFDAAEKSVRRAMELDSKGELPRTEHLLGFILAQKGKYPEALEHLRKYVEISPQATDAEETKALIRKLEAISSPR